MDHAQKVCILVWSMIWRLTGDHSASSALESLHNTLDDLFQQKAKLTSSLRDQLGRALMYTCFDDNH